MAVTRSSECRRVPGGSTDGGRVEGGGLLRGGGGGCQRG
jgi:hypothetical protein